MEPRDRSGPERPYRLLPETTRGPLPSRSRETLPEGLLGASSARAERSRDCGRREMPELGRTTDDPDDQRAGEAGRDVSSFRRVAEATQTRLSPVRQRLARYEHVPVVDVLAGTYRRDRESAGAVIGSAIAFRLFLFFVPLLLLVVGIAGFASDFVTARAASKTAGIYGRLGAEISEAFHQPGFTRWFAVLFGLFGVLTAGRSLSRVLHVASAAAWRLPLSGSRASLRTAGVVAGLICGIAVIAILVNRVRENLGLEVAGLTFVPVLRQFGLHLKIRVMTSASIVPEHFFSGRSSLQVPLDVTWRDRRVQPTVGFRSAARRAARTPQSGSGGSVQYARVGCTLG